MNAVLKNLAHRATRLDLILVGIAGIGLIVFVSHLAPLGRENALLEQQLVASRQSRPPTGASLPPAPDARRFVEALPDDRQRAEDIAQLSALARSHGLQIGQMAFQEGEHGSASDSPLRSLNGRITVEGSYPSIRKWLDEVWGRMPSAGISTLRLNRSGDAPGKMQSRLEFTYYSTALPAHASGEPPRRQRPGTPSAVVGRTFDPFGFPSINRIRQPVQARNDASEIQPAMPFAYGGSYRSADNEVYLMIEGDNVHRIRLGETLPGDQFRLEAADPYRVELIHLPSSRRYTLLTGNLAQ